MLLCWKHRATITVLFALFYFFFFKFLLFLIVYFTFKLVSLQNISGMSLVPFFSSIVFWDMFFSKNSHFLKEVWSQETHSWFSGSVRALRTLTYSVLRIAFLLLLDSDMWSKDIWPKLPNTPFSITISPAPDKHESWRQTINITQEPHA